MYPLSKLGRSTTAQFGNRVIVIRRGKHCSNPRSRGLLPWESDTRTCQQSKEFRKRVSAPETEDCACATKQKPVRNTYEWVLEDDKPCKPPSGFKTAYDKTICELRRLKKCLRIFQGDETKCQNLAPDCSQVQKVYPMMDAVQKGPIPGCAIPLIVKTPDPPKEEAVAKAAEAKQPDVDKTSKK